MSPVETIQLVRWGYHGSTTKLYMVIYCDTRSGIPITHLAEEEEGLAVVVYNDMGPRIGGS